MLVCFYKVLLTGHAVICQTNSLTYQPPVEQQIMMGVLKFMKTHTQPCYMQTMYRIKDPKVSLDFYTRVLGMR